MAYTTKAVANFFLDKSFSGGRTITPIKLQKLVYFAYGWYLAIKDANLFNEDIEAWRYGPVINSLYQEFKRFGSDPINCHATKKQIRGLKIRSVVPRIPTEDQETREILNDVWNVYGDVSGIRLSNLTHQSGSPWHQARQNCLAFNFNPPIDSSVIAVHFKALLETEGN